MSMLNDMGNGILRDSFGPHVQRVIQNIRQKERVLGWYCAWTPLGWGSHLWRRVLDLQRCRCACFPLWHTCFISSARQTLQEMIQVGTDKQNKNKISLWNKRIVSCTWGILVKYSQWWDYYPLNEQSVFRYSYLFQASPIKSSFLSFLICVKASN